MARNSYNPIIHSGGQISSRNKQYNRDASDSGGRNSNHAIFLDPANKINNNSLSYTNSSNVIINRERQDKQNVEVQAAYNTVGVVYKKETTSANGPYRRPRTVNGPLISPLAIAQVWTAPEQSGELPYLGDPCDLKDNGRLDPANPCFRCYNGYWLHLSEISPLGVCGEYREIVAPLPVGRICEAYYYDVGPCNKCTPEEGITPLCTSACEECVITQKADGSLRGSCENACGANTECIGDVCYDTCNPYKRIDLKPGEVPPESEENTCDRNLCMICREISFDGGYIGVCETYCNTGQRCINGRCVDNCWPHCLQCEECVFKNGVWGCELLPEYGEYLADGYEAVCCPETGEIVGWQPPCESLGPNCTVVDECAKQDKVCVTEHGPGVTVPTRSCKDRCKDGDCGPCETCGSSGYCYSTCKRGEFCKNGVCEKAQECKNCETLEFICNDKDQLNDWSCWSCVNNCPQDVLPLECLPVANGKPGEHACQYFPTRILANVVIP